MMCKNCGFRVDNPDTLYCPNCNSYLREIENNSNTFFSPEFTSETINTVDIPRPDNIVNNVSNVTPVSNTVPNDDLFVIEKEKDKTFDGTLFVFGVVFLILGIAMYIFISGINGNLFYFEQGDSTSNVATEETLSEVNKEYEATSKSGQKNQKGGNGVTSVVYDNQYLKQTILKEKKDVDNFVTIDSNNNRANCPSQILEIEKRIENNYGIIAVNLCELDLDFARELEQVAKYIYESYPTARGRITNMTIANVDENATFMASFMPLFKFITSKTATTYPLGVKTMIILNAKYFLNPSRLSSSVKHASNSGYFPKGANRYSTVAHEFGHYLSYVAMLNYYEEKDFNFIKVNQSSILNDIYEDFKIGDFSDKLVKEAYNRYLNKHNGTMNYYEFRKSISLYAVAKDSQGQYIYDETIAEAFHDYYLNGNNAKIASKLILEVLNEYL